MPKYKLTEEDLQDIEDQSSNYDPDVIYENCSICRVRGQLGTCYSDSPYIHTVKQNNDQTNKEDHPWLIYCGYGSPWDSYIFFLTKRDKVFFSSKYYCSNCLKKTLKNLKLVLVYDYFGSTYYLYSGEELTEYIKNE